MGFTVNFTDNQSVSDSDLNAVAESIAEETEGYPYPEFVNDTLYGVDDLNAISASLISKGVSSGCSVSCSGTDVTISGGVAFFADGKKITIDADGISLTRTENVKNYVWLLNDSASGIVSAKCTEEEPEGDYVSLAVISESGIVTEKKDLARMRNSSVLPNCYNDIRISVPGNADSFKINVEGNYRRMVAISEGDVLYFDWDKMVAYGKHNEINEYDLSDTTETPSLLYTTNGANGAAYFLSYENNILTVTNSSKNAGSFTLYCM